jgi:mRNA interferase MazF
VDDELGSADASGRDRVGLRRGAIWWADLPDPWGRRPVLLIARDQAYTSLSRFVVAPLSTRIRHIATSVILEPETDPVPARYVVSLDRVHQIESGWLIDNVGQLSPERLAAVDLALHSSLGIEVCPTR